MLNDKYDRDLKEAQEEVAKIAKEMHERELEIEAKRIKRFEEEAAENSRIKAEAKAKAEIERLANREHVANVLGEIKLSIIGLGATEELAKSITLALYKNNIPNTTVKF